MSKTSQRRVSYYHQGQKDFMNGKLKKRVGKMFSRQYNLGYSHAQKAMKDE